MLASWAKQEMCLTKLRMITPPDWARGVGFSWGSSGTGSRLLSVAGQLAVHNGSAEVEPNQSFAQQFAKCLQNVVAVVRADGGTASDIAMLRAYVRDMAAFKSSAEQIKGSWSELLGKHFPAMTLVEVSMLYDPNALVEIEAFAIIQ